MSDGEDDFVTYGTALDPLDEDNLPRKKPVTLEDQYACDAQGRRRFHGAFTGGFSAGYFNTVGTRDGWKPQQFKSTRSSKAGNVVQKPQDFMDEEDTGEFGIAPTAIRATQGYSNQEGRGTKRERSKHDSTGPIPGTPVLQDLLKPVKERVGVMLLKKMGWKPGQGVGPRLTRKEKKQVQKQREKVRLYGCALPDQQDQESESEDSDDEFANITFAPDDYEPFRCNPKDNYFGIGYSGLDRRPILSGHINLFDAPAFSVQDKNKKLSIKGQAFGVGAFEVEDEDIYAKEDMSRYDFALGPERKAKSRWAKEEKPKNCIEGFVPAKEQFPQKKVFPAPALPKDFQPVHRIRKSRFQPLPEESDDRRKRTEMNAESRAKMINDERPSAIEAKTAETPKSTSTAVNMITRALNLHGKEQTAERERLEKAQPKKTAMSWLDKLSSTAFVKGETLGSDPKIQGSLQSVDTFAAESSAKESGVKPAGTASKGSLSRPSFADLDKQRRFEQYLKFSESERKLKFPSVQSLSMSDWERDREIEEFEKAAKICEKLDSEAFKEDEKRLQEKEKKVDLESLTGDAKMMAAAKLKMFGQLTRTDVEWKPVKLVCVRFNIAEPDVGVIIEDKKKKKFSIFDNMSWNEVSKFEAGQKLEHDVPGTVASSSSSSFHESRERGEKTSVQEVRDKTKSEKDRSFEETYDKIFGKAATSSFPPDNKDTEAAKSDSKEQAEEEPPTAKMNPQEKKDLFKSIFLDSDDSESESEAQPDDADEEKVKAALIGKSAAEQNAQRNTSPPRGVFAKLDLDSLLKRPVKPHDKDTPPDKKAEEKRQEDKNDSSSKSSGEQDKDKMELEDEDLPADVYGPALPKALPSDVLSQRPIFTGSRKAGKEPEEAVWVEKSAKKKSKKEKKKHKHKERSRSKSRKKSKKDKKH